MNNSPLLILNNDISEIIGFYLETIQKHKSVIREFNKNINILQNHFNITVNKKHLIDFNKEIYYDKNQLTMKELLCYRKTGYFWNGKRHIEKIPTTIKLSPFKRSYNKFLNKNYRRSRYVCSCFTYECDNCNLKVDDYLENRNRLCNKKGILLVALYFKNTNTSFIYDYKKLLSEVNSKYISKSILNFKEKMCDNTTHNPNYNIYI